MLVTVLSRPHVLTQIHQRCMLCWTSISFLFYEQVYHSCLAVLRLIMVTASHWTCCAHGLEKQTYPLSAHTAHHHHHPTNHAEGGGDVGSLGYFPTSHQSCLTSPAAPALLPIIPSTVNDSYWVTISPLNITLMYYNTVFPTTGPQTFPSIGPVSFLPVGPLLFKPNVWLPFRHPELLSFLPPGLSFLRIVQIV